MCPNFKKLKACNLEASCERPIFPIEHMQNCLPKLKVLCLGYPIQLFYDSASTAEGSPELTIFTYHVPCHRVMKKIDDKNFKKLLMKSPHLKELNIKGYPCISALNLYSLPTADLEKLNVAGTELYLSKNFGNVLQRWSHSLIESDVSYECDSRINDCLRSFASSGSLQNLVICVSNKDCSDNVYC
ncbi:f-box domain-containing protein [Trichonephila clavipes]|nr:f-box domain-containing protein [Trichonephila clavipes]